MNRRAVAVGAAIVVALVVLVVALTRGGGPGPSPGPTTAGTTATTPGPAPVPVPGWGDFPGAPPDLRPPPGGSQSLTGSGGARVLTIRRADGTVLARAGVDRAGNALDARYFDRRGSLTVAVGGVRVSRGGAAAGGARVRCASSARHDSGFRWTRFPIRWRLGSRRAPGMTAARALAALRRARGTWNATRSHCRDIADRSRARFAFVGPSARATGRDGVNLVEFGDVNALGGVCVGTAACTITFISGGRAVESDTRIDRGRPGGFFTGRARRGALDLQSVLVHESGHTLGFDHVLARSVVMFPAIAAGATGGRLLGRGDALGSNRKY